MQRHVEAISEEGGGRGGQQLIHKRHDGQRPRQPLACAGNGHEASFESSRG